LRIGILPEGLLENQTKKVVIVRSGGGAGGGVPTERKGNSMTANKGDENSLTSGSAGGVTNNNF